MVQLLDRDILTREVTEWRGVHLFHTRPSSCSQKVRIYLNLKGIAWISHIVDVAGKENFGARYLGINPRGLVPTLVHDGAVHIESNDIILYLERTFPDPVLVPPDRAEDIGGLLRHEDDLHLDLRTVTFKFLFSAGATPKSGDDLRSYARHGSGTVGGEPDRGRAREIGFWQSVGDRGIPDAQIVASVAKFTAEFERLDRRLEGSSFLLGDRLSVLDIAWTVYVHRLALCGYPVERRHLRLWRWYRRIATMPEVSGEIALPAEIAARADELRQAAAAEGRTLDRICGI